ncbi:hypothetical protein KC19_1G264700 [Ceratodon purpureus]|uniref:Uncharacterized protein n=1 Tax=Ceratodon purpureus TaxID=3225 RepID=A0A8T0JBC1_CERPU|nr:hypothetical protein KC19_1G264700 [Ceratodon purpureus]
MMQPHVPCKLSLVFPVLTCTIDVNYQVCLEREIDHFVVSVYLQTFGISNLS